MMTRGKFIGFKASEKERKILEVLCEREGRGISEVLREAIREMAASRGLYSVGMVELLSRYEVQHGNNDEN